ncbi:hypothetical protein AO381_0313 [Moraxella catarrhalis]|nr:hypothetical protein AO381_0313 [Moraxella catarrhalis]
MRRISGISIRRFGSVLTLVEFGMIVSLFGCYILNIKY